MKTRATDTSHIGRILKRADFLRLQQGIQDKTARKWITPHLIVQLGPGPAMPNDAAISCRYGITITKKIFPLAVDRNRMRRRLRPLILSVLVAMPGVTGYDLVVLPRGPALKATPETLEKDLKWALKRLLSPEKEGNHPKNRA